MNASNNTIIDMPLLGTIIVTFSAIFIGGIIGTVLEWPAYVKIAIISCGFIPTVAYLMNEYHNKRLFVE